VKVITVVALVVSAAALALSAFAVITRPASEHHRCGARSGYVVDCIGTDTPLAFKDRGCRPVESSSPGVVAWSCKRFSTP
jgi:hypothetical protein